MSQFYKWVSQIGLILIFITTMVHAVGSLTTQPRFGASAIVHNGTGYGRFGVLTTVYDAGIIFKSESNEVTGGATNTNRFDYGVMGSWKASFTETQVLTFGGILTMANGKEQGKTLTGGTYFAPFVGLQQAFGDQLIFDAAYYPFTFSVYKFDGGEIRQNSMNAVSVGFSWLFPQGS